MLQVDETNRQDQPVAEPVTRTAEEAPLPWAMIEPGRYQPKRIKGSCVGRELG